MSFFTGLDRPGVNARSGSPLSRGRARGPLVPGGAPVFAFAHQAAVAVDPDTLAVHSPLTLPVLEDRNDRPIDLTRQFAGQRLLVVFYLGGWSAPCVGGLATLDRARAQLDARCCSVVGISAEAVGRLGDTADAADLGLLLVHDHGARFAEGLGLALRIPATERAQLRAAGISLTVWTGSGNFQLPLPVTLLLDIDRAPRLFVPAATADLTRRSDVDAALRAALEA